ncbi:hypothetical protein JW868_02500 [Candidatus Woesearchaeota archaeon]|nr:hypothetical protein [Candidatus Woesearchaeota archaeon]
MEVTTDKLNKHDRYVEELCDLIEGDYDHISKNVLLHSNDRRRRVIGEIDVIAVKDHKYDVYEVKCSPRFVKTRKQIQRIRKHVPVNKAFFYCGMSGVIVEI